MFANKGERQFIKLNVAGGNESVGGKFYARLCIGVGFLFDLIILTHDDLAILINHGMEHFKVKIKKASVSEA
ncbi:hypothetical protein [Acinetobacter sp.]|uniref:hypothetical protein n=1 Tax=Acinetobacter sp. TaxID=472 RepID=UPI0031DE5D04